jgi:nitrogen fixation-related uncharacterized protein
MSLKLRLILLGAAIAIVVSLVIVFFFSRPQGQFADADYDTKVAQPAYTNDHPKVLFDEAHRNIHTTKGLYSPFANLITSDGYQVIRNTEPFSRSSLATHNILVIANALTADEVAGSSAFTDAECDAVRDWVQAGGSLLLITDHAPTGSAAESLAQRFNVEMSKGMTEDSKNFDAASNDTSQLVFTCENGLLLEHPITQGRDGSETVKRVMTFTGQSLKGPANSKAFMKLGDSAVDRPATIRFEKSGSDKNVLITYGDPVPATGRAQGLALEFGKGRVVVLGEAAMLTAQRDGKTKKPFGMNVQGIDNRQLALNIMHWLSKVL